ncbi:uncharacterized protein LOC107980454 [Nasonia vitripennis]|uniref:Uncharacterized protein n=1 Tax=Nasonia vitripennis TaxID=7425 RepID=A0A7M7QVB9_NASVI|nr:uncharacterized protein LOC107980454 [Nasonia vitripennis]XP_031783525.1 uncharacterized protein LOC107980454 [Nasonia vitripennis]XP_031783526.1 uncharacterized protein LOC107980454 [Nasonia vitripennis]XP_031783527.1 uncharacterized protein LOC107980454 [Nasonia vitripennis]XP_032454160.1 uncharacterized protein LOC107980454 [Nasonia vitripennis]XP_032454161.1 uncharacterized protein LOC107980454 [Nasonia vitripennis]
MDVSPYLSAIQSLSGEIPGEKYKDLHTIAAQIIKNDKEKAAFLDSGSTSRIQPALLPHLRILVGNKLKLVDVVVEALKSDDVLIIKQALGAKWFFDAKNEHISVDYFVQNIVPYISLRTRLELTKTLAHYLVGHDKKADEFFGKFADLYGTEKALPLLVACSEECIFDVVLKRKIVLPPRILSVLYRRYPQLVIRYLQLGNDNNEHNKEERKLHKIDLSQYTGFLPALVKNHTQEFVELYECLPSLGCHIIRLGSTRAEFFLKNGTELLIKKPKRLLELLPLKLVSNKLSTQQFETMFENLFPKDQADFDAHYLISQLCCYPQEKQFNLLEEKYKLLYGKSILDNKDFYFEDWLFKLLPTEKKEEYAKRMLEPLVGTNKFLDKQEYLPPSESIPLLKERISKASLNERMVLIQYMINSCSFYDSKDDLLEVLQYYNTRHKNERSEVLYVMLNTLVEQVDIKTLQKEHWQILWEIIQRAYVKGELFTDEYILMYKQLFNGALHHFLKQCKVEETRDEAKLFLDKLVGIVLDCYLEHKMTLQFMKGCAPELKRECLQKFLTAVPLKYPETHEVWNKSDNKLKFVPYLVRSIHEFNVKNLYTVETQKKRRSKSGATVTDSEGNEIKQSKLMLRDYPWLLKLSVDLIKDSQKCYVYKNRIIYAYHKRTLRQHDRELYQSIIDSDPELINDIESFDAMHVLKYAHGKVLSKWKLYLDACRKKLHLNNKAVMYFVTATKWHQKLPIEFVQQCLLDIKEKGSTLVLGILLEGDAFGKIVQPYLPKDKAIDVDNDDAKKTYEIISSLPKAMNFSNPPVSFEVISAFCQGDYVKLATHTLTSVAQRVPVDRVLTFANQLVDKPISVRKLSIRLVFQVSSKTESREFLARIWSTEKNTSIREVLAKMIFDVFTQTPNDETWQLINVCINGLTRDDQAVFGDLSKIHAVDKQYICQYIQEYLKKIDSFGKDDVSDDVKSRLICKLVDQISVNILQFLTEELITDLVKRELFEYSHNFILDIYLFSEPSIFNKRLNTLMEIVGKKFEDYGQSDPEQPRIYPTNNLIRKFFKKVFDKAFTRDEEEMLTKLTNASLNLISTKLKPWQDMIIFIYGNLAKDYVEAPTLEDFGAKLVITAARLVKEFGSDLILNIVSDLLKDKLCKWRISKSEWMNRTFTVMEILTERNPRLGALLSIKMLNKWELDNYDERYDALVEKWAAIDDPMVRATLYDFQNEI